MPVQQWTTHCLPSIQCGDHPVIQWTFTTMAAATRAAGAAVAVASSLNIRQDDLGAICMCSSTFAGHAQAYSVLPAILTSDQNANSRAGRVISYMPSTLALIMVILRPSEMSSVPATQSQPQTTHAD